MRQKAVAQIAVKCKEAGQAGQRGTRAFALYASERHCTLPQFKFLPAPCHNTTVHYPTVAQHEMPATCRRKHPVLPPASRCFPASAWRHLWCVLCVLRVPCMLCCCAGVWAGCGVVQMCRSASRLNRNCEGRRTNQRMSAFYTQDQDDLQEALLLHIVRLPLSCSA